MGAGDVVGLHDSGAKPVRRGCSGDARQTMAGAAPPNARVRPGRKPSLSIATIVLSPAIFCLRALLLLLCAGFCFAWLASYST